MRFNKSDALADEGVAAVNMLLNQLGWIFREYSKRDVGIDAQVEICRGGFVTSCLLSLQIKAGESYFTEPTGWTYRDGKHLDYYRAHSPPYSWSCTIRRAEKLGGSTFQRRLFGEQIGAGRYACRGISHSASRPESLSRRSLKWLRLRRG
jgi:hypothetical protein